MDPVALAIEAETEGTIEAETEGAFEARRRELSRRRDSQRQRTASSF